MTLPTHHLGTTAVRLICIREIAVPYLDWNGMWKREYPLTQEMEHLTLCDRNLLYWRGYVLTNWCEWTEICVWFIPLYEPSIVTEVPSSGQVSLYTYEKVGWYDVSKYR
jgi:hypothetical protein